MNKRIWYSVTIIALLVGSFSYRLSSAKMAPIVVSGADATMNYSTTSSTTVSNLLSNAADTVITQYADLTIVRYLTSPPNGLQTLLDGMTPTVVSSYGHSRIWYFEAPTGGLATQLQNLPTYVQTAYGNTESVWYLAAPPAALVNQLDALPQTVHAQYGSARFERLSYPFELITENTPPMITEGPTVQITSASSVEIRWVTDEFATSELRYGTSPGHYTTTISNSLYEKNHLVELTGLSVGTTYYYQITLEDLHGNPAVTPEYHFDLTAPEPLIYLPFVIR